MNFIFPTDRTGRVVVAVVCEQVLNDDVLNSGLEEAKERLQKTFERVMNRVKLAYQKERTGKDAITSSVQALIRKQKTLAAEEADNDSGEDEEATHSLENVFGIQIIHFSV